MKLTYKVRISEQTLLKYLKLLGVRGKKRHKKEFLLSAEFEKLIADDLFGCWALCNAEPDFDPLDIWGSLLDPKMLTRFNLKVELP